MFTDHSLDYSMAHSPPSTSGVLPEPICLLCGVAILTTDELGMPKEFYKSKGDLKLDRQPWTKYWKPSRAEHFMVSAYEVENAHYIRKFPRLWCCLYRASKSLQCELLLKYSPDFSSN